MLWQAFMGYIFVCPETHCPTILREHAKPFRTKTGTGRLPMSKISDMTSSINIWREHFWCFWSSFTNTAVTERRRIKKEKQAGNERSWCWSRRRLFFFDCSANNYVEILLSCKYHSTWNTNTVFDSPQGFFSDPAFSRLTATKITCHGHNVPYEADISYW